MLLYRDFQPQQQFAGTRFGGITIVFGEFGFEFGGVHVVVVACLGVRVDRVALGHGLPHFFMAHQHDVEHAQVFERELVLPQLAQAGVRLERDVAGGRFEVATDDFHEGRLAATIRADQAVAVAFTEFDRDVLEQGFGAELDSEVSGRDHGR